MCLELLNNLILCMIEKVCKWMDNSEVQVGSEANSVLGPSP